MLPSRPFPPSLLEGLGRQVESGVGRGDGLVLRAVTQRPEVLLDHSAGRTWTVKPVSADKPLGRGAPWHVHYNTTYWFGGRGVQQHCRWGGRQAS